MREVAGARSDSETMRQSDNETRRGGDKETGRQGGEKSWIVRLLSGVLVACVRGYQWVIRPILPATCRFQPSCSEYFILAVEKYGPIRGALKGLWRIARCHPWSHGGYDAP